MTYVLGWRNNQASFLVTDSAITTKGEILTPDPQLRTSFDERQVREKSLVVQEQMLKIFDFKGRLAMGFAGDVGSALNLAKVLDQSIDPSWEGCSKSHLERILKLEQPR